MRGACRPPRAPRGTRPLQPRPGAPPTVGTPLRGTGAPSGPAPTARPPAADGLGPWPRPAGPWQTRQYVSYRNRPRLIDSEVRVRGFASRSAVCRLISGSAPVTGTVPGTGGIGCAYGLMLR